MILLEYWGYQRHRMTLINIESQMELAKLNNNLSGRITDYNELEEQRREIRKEIIDSIIYTQTSRVDEKEVARVAK
jgi:hypothetical protein